MTYFLSISSVAALLLSILPSTIGVFAQESFEEEGIEEISVGFTVPEVGTMVLPALIDAESRLYLPIVEVFSFLRIRMDSTSFAHHITGYLFDEKRSYSIDGITGTIEIQGEKLTLDRSEMLLTEDHIYMRSDFFGSIFGLYSLFSFRDLEVRLSTDYELPAVRDARRAHARLALRRLYESESFDKGVASNHTLLRLGVADWSVNSTIDSTGRSDLLYTVDLGGEALGGAFEVRVQGENDSVAELSSIPWSWRYVDNEFTPARQIALGNIPSMLPEPLSSSGLGASVTNRSTINRTMHGAYVIENQTEPGWDVELYVDDQLVDFTTADEHGFYRFEIPFRYGSTSVTLRFFGPWGEERLMEETLRIPLSMLPSGEVEYTVSGGSLLGEGAGLFAHAKAEVGINSYLTLGGGIFGVQHNAPESWYPYATGSARLTNSLFLSGRYSPSSGMEGTVNWITPTKGVVELGFQRPSPKVGGEAHTVLEKRSVFVSTSIPFSGTAQFRFVDNVTAYGHGLQGEGSLALRFFGYPLTFDFHGEWTDERTRAMRAITLRGGVRTLIRPWHFANIRPSIELDMMVGRASIGRIDIERQILSGLWANAMATYDFVSTGTTLQFGLRLDLPFARAGTSARFQDGGGVYTAGANGSIVYDSERGTILTGDRSAINRAALAIRPFLDINGNDIRDTGEPLVPDVEVAINGGTIRRSRSDSTIRILGLEPYVPRTVVIDESSLPEISWRPKYRTWRVVLQPNRFQTIDVPIIVVGEAAGVVVRGADENGMRGMIVRFRRFDGTFADSTITYEGGEFYFLGLPPGNYTASLDEEQVRILNLDPEVMTIDFEVKAGKEGDIIEGMEFKVR